MQCDTHYLCVFICILRMLLLICSFYVPSNKYILFYVSPAKPTRFLTWFSGLVSTLHPVPFVVFFSKRSKRSTGWLCSEQQKQIKQNNTNCVNQTHAWMGKQSLQQMGITEALAHSSTAQSLFDQAECQWQPICKTNNLLRAHVGYSGVTKL